MKIRTSFRLAVLATFAIVFAGHSQGVILNAGDSWSYHFSTLDFVGTVSSSSVVAQETFSYTATSLSPIYSLMSFELYEGQPLDNSIYSGGYFFAANSTATSGIGISQACWQDLEGSIRFTPSASFSIDSFTIQVDRPSLTIPNSYDVFETTVIPTPEPSTNSLLATAVAASVLLKFVFRKPQPHPR